MPLSLIHIFYEVHQAYVDGGLYAMNLINALHSLGIGTIPLSVAFGYDKLDNKFDSKVYPNAHLLLFTHKEGVS